MWKSASEDGGFRTLSGRTQKSGLRLMEPRRAVTGVVYLNPMLTMAGISSTIQASLLNKACTPRGSFDSLKIHCRDKVSPQFTDSAGSSRELVYCIFRKTSRENRETQPISSYFLPIGLGINSVRFARFFAHSSLESSRPRGAGVARREAPVSDLQDRESGCREAPRPTALVVTARLRRHPAPSSSGTILPARDCSIELLDLDEPL